jgi:hypothetical protein
MRPSRHRQGRAMRESEDLQRYVYVYDIPETLMKGFCGATLAAMHGRTFLSDYC